MASLRQSPCPHCGRPRNAEGGNSCESCLLDAYRDPRLEKAIERLELELVEALVEALDAREHETGMHSKRVACHTLVLAHAAGENGERRRHIYYGSLLHDIGKMAIPDAILLKQGSLTPLEWEQVKCHPEAGYRIIAHLPFLGEAASIVLSHEERFDGSGYPRGLKGDEIPWGARLFSLIDTLDAMTSDRPYRKALAFDQAKAEIERMSGRQFDPRAVALFLAEEAVLREMVALKCFLAPQDFGETPQQ
jgi:HD-GYP domain-containing protein (c-di-GMP phosphodiesterase class II)